LLGIRLFAREPRLFLACSAGVDSPGRILMAFAILRPPQAHRMTTHDYRSTSHWCTHQLAPAGVLGAASSSARQAIALPAGQKDAAAI
jgi:hypothetical protein